MKLIRNGRSQTVRLPAAFRFEGCETVFIRCDPETGNVILSRRPDSWGGFLAALRDADVPGDFLTSEDRSEDRRDRDPFAGGPASA